MARPVRLNVDVDLTAARAKLRAFEARVLRATQFGATGRPSGSPFIPVGGLGPRRPGVEAVVRRDPIGRIQQTLPLPVDQTALGLSTVAHLAQGSRIAGLSKALQESVVRSPTSAAGIRRAAPSIVDFAMAEARRDLISQGFLAGDIGQQAGTLEDVANMERFKQKRMQFAPVPKRVGRLRRIHDALGARALPAAASGFSGKIRSGFEVAGAGGITSRTTVAGIAVAAFAYVRQVSEVRQRLLREAAESGDPTTFSYGQVAEEGAIKFGISVKDIAKSASILSATTGLTLVEGLGQLGIKFVGGLASILPGLDTGSTNFDQASRDFSKWAGSTVAAADGSQLQMQAVFKGEQDAWSRGFDESLFRAGIFKEKIVKARGEQALAFGFNFGSLGEIEDQLASEIGNKVRAAAVTEYDAANPYPGLKAQTGKKE